MKDWINDMCYTSWCRTILKNYIEESVKGHVCVHIVKDDALIEILSPDYSRKWYSYIAYDFGKRMERHEITDIELENLSTTIVVRFRSKILGKYFK